MSRTVEPSVTQTAFNCPHCSTFTTQYWYRVFAKQIDEEKRLPVFATEAQKAQVEFDREMKSGIKPKALQMFDQLLAGFIVLEETKRDPVTQAAYNLHLTQCYNCKKLAVWVHDRLLFPPTKPGILPNPDLPDDVVADFEEARGIVDSSPRGAAALLRLCIQKLCLHLGEKGKNIDDDIASLVSKGLNPMVQQALDIVRVVGNEAVHPGTMDLKDDRDTALRLFELVNSIADQMISHPKNVKAMYSKLPETKRDAIAKRDKK
jgi:hypothetical protein